MKKIYILFLLFFALFSNAQNGITYQAVILNPKGEELPGADNSRAPLVNTNICLRFKILKGESLIEYQEILTTTTDEFGMVNVIIGTGTKTGGTALNFAAVNWDGNPKNLVVELDTTGNCSSFLEISNQPFTSVPFALYAANSGTPGTPGPAGPQGIQGLKGDTGAQGIAGPIGTVGLTGPQGIQGLKGDTGVSGPQGIQGLKGDKGDNGLAGTNGNNGLNALIKTTVEPAGVNCSNGGTKIEVGLDSNSNGLLENSEINVAQTKYVCNGAQGVAGPQGIQGPASNSIGANAAFSDAITTYNGDISICGTYTSIAVSDNGKFIILGCQSHTGIDNSGNNINSAGKVSVLKYENGTFENVGQEFIGPSLNSRYGLQVGISGDGLSIFFTGGTPNDGYIYKLVNNTWVLHSTIPSIGFIKTKMNAAANLIVSLDNSGNTTQSITFYKLVGNNWVSSQFLANGILGNSDLQISNDGSIIALSNAAQNLGALGGFPTNGRIGVFFYDGTTFTQRGNFIEGPNTRGWGYRLCLSDDGTKIGISSQRDTVSGDSTDPCYIRTYHYNASSNLWSQYNNELVFRSNNQGGEITFFDYDSSSNYLIVAHKIESPFANGDKKSYFLLMKDLNNNWNQYGTRIEFIPTLIPDNFEFKSNIFFYVQDDKIRIKDFN